MTDPQTTAAVLNQALPYIQAFRSQTFVVKYGGSAMRDPATVENVVRNVLLLRLVGIRVVLVHGGGPEIDELVGRLGLVKRVVNGLRVTDAATMEAVEMALLRANKGLVAEIQRLGGSAVGLSGRDDDLLLALPVSDELGHVGSVARVHPRLLLAALGAEVLPVLCSVASDPARGPLNVNADAAAAAVAVALEASKLILLTDTDGVRRDPEDPRSRLAELSAGEARRLIAGGQATRGMIPKLEAALEALDGGVPAVHLLNGANPNALLVEVFTDAGVGTMMVRA